MASLDSDKYFLAIPVTDDLRREIFTDMNLADPEFTCMATDEFILCAGETKDGYVVWKPLRAQFILHVKAETFWIEVERRGKTYRTGEIPINEIRQFYYEIRQSDLGLPDDSSFMR